MGAVNNWQQSNMKSVLAAIVITLAAVQGQHVHNIEWKITGKPFEECIAPGEAISFNWVGKEHNVIMVKEQEYINCNGGTNEADEGPVKFPGRNFRQLGNYYFVCGVGGHCEFGKQKANITVDPSC